MVAWSSSVSISCFNVQSSIGHLSCFYRTWVRSLAMLVTHSLTNSLTHSLPFSKLDWCDPGVWRCLLKICWGCYCCWWIVMRIVLATVCYRFGSWGLVIKLNFCSDFEHFGQDFNVEGEILKWSLVSILLFGWGYEVESWSIFWSYVWSRFWL